MNTSKTDLQNELQRYLLKPVVLCLIGPGLLYGLFLIISWFTGRIHIVGASLGGSIMLFCILAFWQNRLGKIRTSSYMSVLAFFLIIYGGSYNFGIGHALVIGYAIVAMLAGMLIDMKAALFFALISMSAYMIIGQAQREGIIPQGMSPDVSILPDAIGLVLALSALVVFLWLYERQMILILNRDRDLKTKVIESNRMLNTELAERMRTEDEIKQKLAFEKTITSISSRFVGTAEIDSTIVQSLGDIGRLCGSQCAYLCILNDGQESFKETVEWCIDPKVSQNKTFIEILIQFIPQWFDRLCQGEVIHLTESESFPSLQPDEQEKLKKAAIFSLLIFPLQIDGEYSGFISLFNNTQTTKWSEEDITVLRIFSEIIGNALTRKKLEEQLIHSQKMEAIGRLAGGVAHDFNNILTAIMGYTHLALLSITKDSPLYGNISDIKDASERASSLTNQLLAFSRKQILKPEVLNLNTLISSMEKMIRRLIGEDIEIVTKQGSSLRSIEADRVQIEQIIMNLAVNARDAMPRGGTLTLETKSDTFTESDAQKHQGLMPGNYIILSVKDTGCGMDTDTKLHIFEPFFTTKAPDKGTGLGLATVYGIVKQSHGKIFVDSEPDQGTNFSIYFPACEKEVSVTTPEATISEPLKGIETILVVEDNDAVRIVIERSLQYFNYQVLSAANPEKAMQLGKEYKGLIHLLVTDVILPKMSGHELAGQLSAMRPEMKVLFVSGFADGTIAPHGVLDSGVAFIPKPFSPEELAIKVREVIDQA